VGTLGVLCDFRGMKRLVVVKYYRSCVLVVSGFSEGFCQIIWLGRCFWCLVCCFICCLFFILYVI